MKLIQQASLIASQPFNKTSFAFFDLETTGVEGAGQNYIGITDVAVKSWAGGRRIGKWSSLVNPEINIPSGAADVTQITNLTVQNAIKTPEALQTFLQQTQGKVLVGHNIIDYDIPVLQKAAQVHGIELGDFLAVDTLKLAKAYSGESDIGYRLSELVKTRGKVHSALVDVRLTETLFSRLTTAGNYSSLADIAKAAPEAIQYFSGGKAISILEEEAVAATQKLSKINKPATVAAAGLTALGLYGLSRLSDQRELDYTIPVAGKAWNPIKGHDAGRWGREWTTAIIDSDFTPGSSRNVFKLLEGAFAKFEKHRLRGLTRLLTEGTGSRAEARALIRTGSGEDIWRGANKWFKRLGGERKYGEEAFFEPVVAHEQGAIFVKPTIVSPHAGAEAAAAASSKIALEERAAILGTDIHELLEAEIFLRRFVGKENVGAYLRGTAQEREAILRQVHGSGSILRSLFSPAIGGAIRTAIEQRSFGAGLEFLKTHAFAQHLQRTIEQFTEKTSRFGTHLSPAPVYAQMFLHGRMGTLGIEQAKRAEERFYIMARGPASKRMQAYVNRMPKVIAEVDIALGNEQKIAGTMARNAIGHDNASCAKFSGNKPIVSRLG